MNDPIFPIRGPETSPMLGRAAIMQRLWNDLTKNTPSNLALIGPRFIGKTVIINALAQRMGAESSPFEFVIHWHLGHVAPTSDEEFIAHLCQLLAESLASGSDTSSYRTHLNRGDFKCLVDVTDFLDSEDRPVLMLWDGLDKPLGQGNLTGHLWDQMRTIFYGKKHKIVTAARKLWSELARSEDAITSPFWNIFDMNPVRVGVFDDGDCEAVFEVLSDFEFEPGAETELENWSSSFPPFFLELLNQVVASDSKEAINNVTVNRAAILAIERLEEMISALWREDCSASAQDLYVHLVERGDQSISDVGREERTSLLEKGFAEQEGNKIKSKCRMLQEYVKNASPDAGSMGRLFGAWNDYRANIRSLLERRLKQIGIFDERLFRLVSRAIEDIPEYPNDCLNNLTSIEERALDLIWQSEFGEARHIPQELVDYWDGISSSDTAVLAIKRQTENVVPGDRALQCSLLQLLTGSGPRLESRANYVSKDAYVLINAIHSFRNRSQHADGQEMHVGVAVAAIMSCLELLSCLERELRE